MSRAQHPRENPQEAIIRVSGLNERAFRGLSFEERKIQILKQPKWQEELSSAGITTERQLEDQLNAMNKSRFKEAMRTTGKVLGTTASALLWPVKMAGKGLYKAGSWFLEHPIRNTLIGGALLYFGAPYLFKAAGAAEGAFAGVGLDWLRRRTQTLSKLGTGTNPSAPPDTGRPTAPRPSVM